jgi:hypothetical protein
MSKVSDKERKRRARQATRSKEKPINPRTYKGTVGMATIKLGNPTNTTYSSGEWMGTEQIVIDPEKLLRDTLREIFPSPW